MRLECRSPSCFSSRYVLKLDGRPHGQFSGRWFSERIDIRMTDRRNLHLKKAGWLGSHFQLWGASDPQILGEADREGFLSSAWGLKLTVGPARLVSAGFFNSAYLLEQQGRRTARVDRIGFCEGGWYVEGDRDLALTDLLLVGLIYHTILERRRNSD